MSQLADVVKRSEDAGVWTAHGSYLSMDSRADTTVGEMSARIDNLETAISDLMHDGAPPSPSPAQRR